MRKVDRIERRSEAGFVLVESMSSLLFYLVMIGAIGAIILMLFSGSKLASTEQEVGTIRLQVRQLYSATNDYSGLTTDLAKTAGAIPSSMIRGDGSVQNAWGGEVEIEPSDSTTNFQITVKAVPKSEAVKLAMFQSGTWVDVLLNDTSIAEAENLLTAATEAVIDSNTITFVSN